MGFCLKILSTWFIIELAQFLVIALRGRVEVGSEQDLDLSWLVEVGSEQDLDLSWTCTFWVSYFVGLKYSILQQIVELVQNFSCEWFMLTTHDYD